VNKYCEGKVKRRLRKSVKSSEIIVVEGESYYELLCLFLIIIIVNIVFFKYFIDIYNNFPPVLKHGPRSHSFL